MKIMKAESNVNLCELGHPLTVPCFDMFRCSNTIRGGSPSYTKHACS